MAKMGSAQIAAQLRREILQGSYRQHDRLPASRELAQSFGVARNTLRDALGRLEQEGLLETRPGSGTFVTFAPEEERPRAIQNATPLELVDARYALEPHICRLCVLHGRREDFEVLEELCTRMEAAENDPVAFAETDAQFHKTLAQTTRNTLLNWIMDRVSNVRLTDEWTRMRHLTLNGPMIREYNIQHRQIVNAIRSREPERAASLMKTHLETARLSMMRAADA
ncbi:MAG: FadR family transcriptional regulator [Alphaproteobacteria bacterium]|nr:MAG: FadR family transcriptional regulator [Alphaproteobacteria bacterium]